MMKRGKPFEETRDSSSPKSVIPSNLLTSMDVKTQSFLQIKDVEVGDGFYMKNKETPLLDTFTDPLCKLHLKETSEFVKGLPMTSSSSNESRGKREGGRRLEAPSTPGRPVFSFSVGNLSRKGFPSKWDDAQKWLINSSSCNDSPSHLIKPSKKQQIEVFQQKEEAFDEKISSFNGSVEVLLKDKFTDNVDPKDGFMFKNSAYDAMRDVATSMVLEHRDVGTEMTPLGSSTTSRCHTPFQISSPARHNTPADRSGPLGVTNKSSTINVTELQECHFAKLELGTQFDSVASNWSSREEEEEEISKSLRHFETDEGCRKSVVDSRVCAWEEEERTKSCIRYQREEAKIQAWVNLQSAKAEAQSRKLEVKIQKMRSQLEEKLMKRMAIVHRKAEELRIEAQQQHSQQIQKATEQAHKMKNQHNSYHSCGCFPCSNNNNHHL